MKLDEMTPENIVSYRQNNPELVIRDCIEEFGFDEKECDRMRLILMARGINKSLLARRKFIALKHEIKECMKESKINTVEYKIYSRLNERMQNIAKLPRWVEFPKSITHNLKNIERDIIIKGKQM